ncbi:MAG: type IV toxin-antitoxin system AbiEi family antitoxin [Nitrospirota bacterium]
MITELTRSKKMVFSLPEATKILGANNKQVKKLLHDLVNQGWLNRVEKGKYFLIPLSVDATKPYTQNQFLIASNLVYPYYVGLWSMLHYYGYTEQLINTIFIISPKRKKDFTLSGVNYKFVKTSARKMFGLTKIEIDGMAVQVSDKEKTILDCLDHPEYCGGITEVVKGIWIAREELDFDRILNYVRKLGNSAVAKRLGYLLETLGIDKKISTENLKKIIKKGFSPLDPLLPKKGRYNTPWNLLVNITKEELLSFRVV